MSGVSCKTVDIFTVSSLFFLIIIISQVVQEYIFLGGGGEHCREVSKFLWPLSPIPVLSPWDRRPVWNVPESDFKVPTSIGLTWMTRTMGVRQAHVPTLAWIQAAHCGWEQCPGERHLRGPCGGGECGTCQHGCVLAPGCDSSSIFLPRVLCWNPSSPCFWPGLDARSLSRKMETFPAEFSNLSNRPQAPGDSAHSGFRCLCPSCISTPPPPIPAAPHPHSTSPASVPSFS